MKLTLTQKERLSIHPDGNRVLYSLICECDWQNVSYGGDPWSGPDDLEMTVPEKIAMKLFKMAHDKYEWPSMQVHNKIMGFLESIQRYMLKLTLEERVNLHTIAYNPNNELGILCDLISDAVWTHPHRKELEWEGEYDIYFYFGYELAWSVIEHGKKIRTPLMEEMNKSLVKKLRSFVSEVRYDNTNV